MLIVRIGSTKNLNSTLGRKTVIKRRHFASTRSGEMIAAASAAMNSLGQNCYIRFADVVMRTRPRLEAELAVINRFYILGDQPLELIAFARQHLDIFAIADQMEMRGWYMSRLANPPDPQTTITALHAPVIETYVADLKTACVDARANAARRAHRPVMTY